MMQRGWIPESFRPSAPIHQSPGALQVGKYDDPATARRGETLYEFVPRSIIGHLRDGSAMERQRMNAKGIAPCSPRSR